MKIKLVLEQIDAGCIIPTSHKLNQDGYFRKLINGKMEMYHRTMWREENGDIPKGYEIDHKCKNRACCNVEHLQILTRQEHLKKDNHERYKPNRIKARLYWEENTEVTGTKLGELFGVSFGQGCMWIRKWKLDNNLDRG